MDPIGKRRELTGRTVLVTGATGDIGRAVVRRLAAEGARPILHFGSRADVAGELLDEIGGDGFAVGADLSTRDGATRLWDEALARAGRIDTLVNNAGIRSTARLDGDLAAWQAAWERELRVDLLAPADLCRAALRHFREIGGGRIVNVASRAGQRGYMADHMPYGAAKAGLLNLTKSIARNCGADGVIAVAIAPGFVHTDMADAVVATQGLAAAVGDIPIGAMAEPEEIAELIAFVLRPSQRSLNGATLDVNGGSYLR